MESPNTVKWLTLIYSLYKEHVSFMNKVTQIAQQEHPVQQLTTHLAIYTNTRLGVEVLRVISANFPCSWFKMSSRVKEREKKKKKH